MKQKINLCMDACVYFQFSVYASKYLQVLWSGRKSSIVSLKSCSVSHKVIHSVSLPLPATGSTN